MDSKLNIVDLSEPNSMDLTESLTILMLVGEEERYIVPQEIMIENVTLRSDGEIKDELLNRQYDTVFITKDYSRMYGDENVKNIIKLFTTLTSTRIHYLQSNGWVGGEDEVSVYLKSIGNGNITKIDISQLDVRTLRILARENKAAKRVSRDSIEARQDNLVILENELRMLPENMMQDYVKRNRGKLLEVISSYLTTMAEIREVKLDNQRYIDKNLHLTNENKSLNKKLISMTERRDIIREDFSLLRKSILAQKDKVDEYNDRLVGSEIVDNPKVIMNEMSPIIIYFKEIEDIGFFHFYESILYTLSKVYKYYVKSVVLETHNRHYFDPYTELGYVAIPKETTIGSIIENDKLLRYGNPAQLLETLANPEFKTEIIMIYDRTQTDEVLIESPYLFPMYIGYEKSKIRTLDIDEVGWISPNEGVWKNVKPLLTYGEKDKNNRIVFNSHVSKHPLTTYLRELVNI